MKAFSAYVHRNEVLHAYALARCTASPTVVVRGFILDCAMHGVDNASIAQHVGYMLDKMADLMKVMLAEEHRAKQDEAVAAYDCAVGGTFSATHSLPGLLHEKEQDAHGSAAEVETASAAAAAASAAAVAVEAQHPVRTATPEPVAARIRREEPKHLPVTPKRALLSPPMDLTQNTIMQQIDKEKLRKRNIPRVATIAAAHHAIGPSVASAPAQLNRAVENRRAQRRPAKFSVSSRAQVLDDLDKKNAVFSPRRSSGEIVQDGSTKRTPTSLISPRMDAGASCRPLKEKNDRSGTPLFSEYPTVVAGLLDCATTSFSPPPRRREGRWASNAKKSSSSPPRQTSAVNSNADGTRRGSLDGTVNYASPQHKFAADKVSRNDSLLQPQGSERRGSARISSLHELIAGADDCATLSSMTRCSSAASSVYSAS